jgi:hypothetical protein
MPLIDDRGRVFGKVNIIDGLVGLGVLVLIPLAYGAFLLFRAPIPTITSVEPHEIAERDKVTLKITGQNLRPFLRAKLGTIESSGFLVQSPTLAEIKIADLPAGTYDLTLFDEARKLVARPAALVVQPPAAPPPAPPAVEVQVVGEFTGIPRADAHLIQAGFRLGGASADKAVAEVLAARPPEAGTRHVRLGGNNANTIVATPVPYEAQVPAVIRLKCQMASDQCKVGDVVVTPDAGIALPWGAAVTPPDALQPGRQVTFLVKEVRAADAPIAFPSLKSATATIRVRFLVRPELMELVKAGDIDASGPPGAPAAARAALVAVDAGRERVTATTIVNGTQFQQPMVAFESTIRVPVVPGPTGWSYNDRPVKAGTGFTFDALTYSLTGLILDAKFGPITNTPTR